MQNLMISEYKIHYFLLSMQHAFGLDTLCLAKITEKLNKNVNKSEKEKEEEEDVGNNNNHTNNNENLINSAPIQEQHVLGTTIFIIFLFT